MINFKDCENKAVQEEYKQVRRWIEENPDKATNLLMNFYCDMFQLDINFQCHALQDWLEIKNLKEKRDLPPACKFDGYDVETMEVLNNFKTEKDYTDYTHPKILDDDKDK